MKNGPIRNTLCRLGLAALIAICGMFLPGTVGCDNPDVQNTIWQGANDLVISLVNALFQAIKPVTSTTTTPVTVSWIAETAGTVIC
jgi:hypothetical protein